MVRLERLSESERGREERLIVERERERERVKKTKIFYYFFQYHSKFGIVLFFYAKIFSI